MRRDRNIALLVLATCISFGKDVAAAEWAVKGAFEQGPQYSDNIAFSTVQKDAVVGYLLKPSLEATRKTEALNIGFEGQGDIRRYDNSHWDCDNYNLNSNNSYQTQRSVFNLNGGYKSSCSYIQQIEDTGLLAPNTQSTNYQVAPSWTWKWTPRDQFSLSPSYSKTSYSSSLGDPASSVGLNFRGNETYTVKLGGSHDWSERLSLNEKLVFSNIQYTGSDTSTQNLFGFQLGAEYEISHNWAADAYGGPMWVDSQPGSGVTAGQSSSSLGSVAGISLKYIDDLTQLSTGFTNSINPSAIGQTLQTSLIFANYSYRLTRQLLLELRGNYRRSESIGDISANQFNRDYYTVAPGVAWEFTKDWRLKGSYTYSWQDYQRNNNFQNLNNNGSVDSNTVMFSLDYSWDGIRISR